jgi:hypothetical protein
MPNKETFLIGLVGVHCLAVAFVALLIMIVAGCARMHMEYLPGLEGPSPLRAIGPLTFVVGEFKDPTDNRVIIKALLSPPALRSTMEQKPGEIVRTAIAAELVRNGHRVLPDQDAEKADVVLDGAVVDFKVTISGAGMWRQKFEPTVTTTLRLTSNGEPRRILLSKEYKGVAEPFRCVLCPSAWGQRDIAEELLKRALRSLVRNITLDPAFLDALKEINK